MGIIKILRRKRVNPTLHYSFREQLINNYGEKRGEELYNSCVEMMAESQKKNLFPAFVEYQKQISN